MATNHAEILDSYRRFRNVGVHLNNKLVRTLDKGGLHSGGERLGMLRQGTLVFETEDESSVLMDYCIHNVWIDGRNAVQKYLAESPPRAGSDEMVLLRAKEQAYYSLIQVAAAEPGVGVTVIDVLRHDTNFLADIGFSHTAAKDDVLATRVIPMDDYGFRMTSGAALPVEPRLWVLLRKALDQAFGPETDYTHLDADQESDLAALVIRACLEAGMSTRIAYGTHAENSTGSGRAVDPRAIRRANRNDPCPCGSGRKRPFHRGSAASRLSGPPGKALPPRHLPGRTDHVARPAQSRPLRRSPGARQRRWAERIRVE